VSFYQQIATATFKKDSRVNIRMSNKDIHAIQVKALEEGIPYQTLISSVLHKNVAGKLKEKEL
jgi:predicted DNA binding CopG/RHH family protein